MVFIRAFDARIASKATSAADCLYFLEQQLEGEPKDLIAGCMYMSHEGVTKKHGHFSRKNMEIPTR